VRACLGDLETNPCVGPTRCPKTHSSRGLLSRACFAGHKGNGKVSKADGEIAVRATPEPPRLPAKGRRIGRQCKGGAATRSTRRSNARPGSPGKPDTGERGLETNVPQTTVTGSNMLHHGVICDQRPKEMEHLHKLAVTNRDCAFKTLERSISEEWVSQAWEEIRRNKGSQTPGIDTLTAEDIDLPRIHRLCERLRNGTYRPKAVRRT